MSKRRKKKNKYRGSHTHGGGSKKKRRGAGNRGGRGNAGSGKKGDSKKPSYWKDKDYFGKKGHKRQSPRKTTINLNHLDTIIDGLVNNGKAKLEKDTYKINLKDIGIEKLLGSGFTEKKLEITTKHVSEKAKNRVEEAGGKVIKPEA